MDKERRERIDASVAKSIAAIIPYAKTDVELADDMIAEQLHALLFAIGMPKIAEQVAKYFNIELADCVKKISFDRDGGILMHHTAIVDTCVVAGPWLGSKEMLEEHSKAHADTKVLKSKLSKVQLEYLNKPVAALPAPDNDNTPVPA